jgi:hypothetical protein
MTRLALLGAVSLVILGLGPAGAQGALLDASCPGPTDDGTTINASSRVAQTFTAAHTGSVVRAEVALNKTTSGGPFTAQILDTDSGGVPVNGVLGSGTTPDSSVPDGPTTLSVAFSTPASVLAGHQYALAITRDTDWFLTDRHGNPCPGEEFYSDDQTSPFAPDPSHQYDFVFSVFVNPLNSFTIGKQKGTKLSLTLPGPGTLTVTKKKLLKTTTKTASAAGPVALKLKLTKKAKQRLSDRGKLALKAAITFTPTGGDPGTQTKKLKFKQK